MRWVWFEVGIVCLGLATCTCCRKEPTTSAAPPQPPAEATTSNPSSSQVVDLLKELNRCDLGHRGVFLDLGSTSSEARFGFDLAAHGNVTHVPREGAVWAQALSRSVSQTFYTDHPSQVFVSGRMRGIGARAATARIDGRLYGTIQMNRSAAAVSTTKVSAEPLEAGNHTLSLSFHGGSHGQPFAEIDWLRVGEADEDSSTFAPPTERDVFIDTMIANRPRRAIGLRAPGTVRCVVAVRDGMVLQASLGYLGPGGGEAEVHVAEPGQASVVVHAASVRNDSDEGSEVKVPLDSFTGKLVALELVAKRSSPGGRVLFGEPSINTRVSPVPPRTAPRVTIIVVLSSADRAHLPPYTDVPALAALTNLASSSVVFRQHRATTTVTSGSFASLMTGLAPHTHTVMDSGARLPARLPTIATIAREGRVASAMFTGNPMTFQAFGFDRGWDRFASFSPIAGTATRTPLIEGSRWIEARLQESKDERLLVVVHAKGGHPPWTASSDESRNLPPVDYAGPIEPRRGGQVLARARGKRSRWRFSNADRERVDALYQLALVSEDQQLDALIASLRKVGLWDSTLLMVTSDVAMGGAGRVPFGDGERLEEDLLDLPLIVHFPGERYAGRVVQAQTTTLDVAVTVLAALGLQVPDGLAGTDLYEVAASPEQYTLRPQFALLGREYATRVGELVLHGESPKAPILCDLTLGPSCTGPTPSSLAIVAGALWRDTYSYYQKTAFDKAASGREPATVDPDTYAALVVWGNQESKL